MKNRMRIGYLALTEREVAVVQSVMSLVPQFSGKYELTVPAEAYRCHIVLVNSDYPVALRWWSAIQKHNKHVIPLMLSTLSQHASEFQLKRPIQATPLIEAMELAIDKAMQGLISANDGWTPRDGEASDVLNILVVDDSFTIRNYMEHTLPKLDNRQINIRFASSGEEALECMSTEAFDLVFLDVVMPGIDGYKVCKTIKADGVSRVVMLTSKKSPIDKVRSSLLGCDGFITKPPSLKRLRGEILKCRQARDAARRELVSASAVR